MRLKRCCRSQSLVVLIVVLLTIVFEEIYFAKLRNLYRNFYFNSVYRQIYAKREEGEVDVAILTVLKNRNNYEEYALAQSLFECYAIYHRYRWVVADVSLDENLQKKCPHKDFMFQRHCVAAELLSTINEEWVLVIDADMAVVNPNRLIEEWVDKNYNIIFYERIFNFEIMAGSYLLRNTPYSRRFLRFWADYEYKLPNSFHGTDNGAIHSAVTEFIYPERSKERKECEKLWKQSRSYSDLALYEACIRHLLGPRLRWPGQIKVLGKGEGWARDTWLTDSMWGDRDFILHGWQFGKMDAVIFGSWPSPLASHSMNMSWCAGSNAGLNWVYKDTFIRSNTDIECWLNATVRSVERDYRSAISYIARHLRLPKPIDVS